MLGLGTSEILMILAALLLFFGAKQLPQLARGLGQGIQEFKDATRDIESAVEDTTIK